MKHLLLFFTLISFGQSHKFIPLDEETLEFIDQVNYTLYANKNPIFSNLTSKDSITRLPKEIAFDSIAFHKLNYKEIGFKKERLKDVVYLKKLIYELDEIIIPNSKPKEIVIGEESRIVKNDSRILTGNPDFGLLFHENDLKNKKIKRLIFFVDKVKYRTTYKIKFYAAKENGNPITLQNLELIEALFESPILTLESGKKNKVEVNLEDYNIIIPNRDVFVCIEQQHYYDENNLPIQPTTKDKTKLQFQLSKLTNYYSKMYNMTAGSTSNEIVNINALINHDFAFQFYKKPHKSQLIAPAIILIADRIN